MERLQKYMAMCGVASRRTSEKIISEGRVKVNGVVVTEMGFKVTNNDIVTLDDEVLSLETEKKYYVMNKPRGVLSTVSDPKGRKTVISILPDELKQYRLFPVGRLDYDTKGVLLLTNDGEFMNTLVGPKSNTEKEYLIRVRGLVRKDDVNKLTYGIKIDNYKTRPCKATVDSLDSKNNSSLLRIIIAEGKYHQVKKMVEAIGFEPIRLTRIRFGRIELDNLAEGEVRELTIHEVRALIGDANSAKTYNEKQQIRKF